MALAATVAWEVRPTNGTANAGGGFDASGTSPGTDYSQQNGVQVAFNGTTITAANSGVSANIVITGYAAAATDNRNLIAITGGTNFITGIYEIVAVTPGVSGVGAWTLDRNCTTGVGAAMTGNMGGARSGFSGGTTTLQASVVAGNKVWVKNEAWNEAVACSVAGSAGTPIVVEGYNAARGDVPTGTNRPLNDRATTAGVAISFTGGNVFLKYLMATRAGSQGFNLGTRTVVVGCRSYNNGTIGYNCGGNIVDLVGCEGDTNTTTGATISGNGTFIGCALHNNTTFGMDMSSAAMGVVNNLIYANSSTGISATSAAGSTITGNTINGNTGASSDGIVFTSPNAGVTLMNNILSNNGRYGANSTAGGSVWADYNDYFSNGTAARNGGIMVGANDQTLDPQFTNSASGDFSIGTNLKALGFPGAFPTGLSTGYMDIGAVQRQESSSGAGVVMSRVMAGF